MGARLWLLLMAASWLPRGNRVKMSSLGRR